MLENHRPEGGDAHGGARLSPQSLATQRVLLVDESADSRQVLRTILERGGVEVHEADRAARGLKMIRQHSPDLVVLDLESQAPEDCDACREASKEIQSSLVVLGTFPRRQLVHNDEQRVAKPYHFAPLIRTIQTMLKDLGDCSPSRD